jgi:hypothetical protein
MNKQQISYITNRLDAEANKAIAAFMKGRPTTYTQEQRVAYIEGELAKTDLSMAIRREVSQIAMYFDMPANMDHLDNQRAIDEFKARVNAEKQRALDAVNLGDSANAVAILNEFAATIAELTR